MHCQVYKDDNHKPEMAIALSDFEALCGFVEHGELLHALETVPELQAVIGQVRLRACMQACPAITSSSRTSMMPTGALRGPLPMPCWGELRLLEQHCIA